MTEFAKAGSQRWLQIAVNRKPQLLLSALRRSGAIGPRSSVTWQSPLEADGFHEYRDQSALTKAQIASLKKPLSDFWPARGPVWDAIGVTSESTPVFIEAKAHIPEALSPATRASAASRDLIEQSLIKARRFYAPPCRRSVEQPFLSVRESPCVPVLLEEGQRNFQHTRVSVLRECRRHARAHV